VIDSLRADALSSYGETRWSTPRIDAVAASGVRFADVTSASPSSTPSTVSILSSRLPEDHGVCGTHGRIREGIPTLATAFRSHGYQTVAIAAGPLLSRLNGIDEGFDRWDEDTDPSFVSSHPRVLTASFMGMFGRKRREESPPADEMVERASQHLAGGSPAPRFVFLQLMDPHDPYAPPGTGAQPSAPGTPSKIRFRPGTLASILRGEIAVSDDDVETARILYGREVESVDAAVGRLLDELRARIESGSLIVALTSNHGEEFMEHGSLGHGHSLHEEVIRVPLIVSRAGAAIRGTEIAEPVSLLDLAPTLLDLAGVPAEPAFAGRSLRPLVEGRAGDETRRSPIVSQMDAVGWHTTTRWARSAREGRYKVVFSATNVLGTGEWSRRIYDLGSDPAESAPANESGAAADLPAGARALAAWLDGHVRDRSPLAVPRDQGDPQRIRRLRSLGYVD
jgi:arylsulfatase